MLGLIGGPLIIASRTAVLFGVFKAGSAPQVIATVPEFVGELSLGIYLMIKGFKPSPILPRHYRTARNGRAFPRPCGVRPVIPVPGTRTGRSPAADPGEGERSRRGDTDDHDAVRLGIAVAAGHRACRLLEPHSRRCRTASQWRRIRICAVFQLSFRHNSRSQAATVVIRSKTNRRHMIRDHHGRSAGRATLLVRATDRLPGTHTIASRRFRYRSEISSAQTRRAIASNQPSADVRRGTRAAASSPGRRSPGTGRRRTPGRPGQRTPATPPGTYQLRHKVRVTGIRHSRQSSALRPRCPELAAAGEWHIRSHAAGYASQPELPKLTRGILHTPPGFLLNLAGVSARACASEPGLPMAKNSSHSHIMTAWA